MSTRMRVWSDETPKENNTESLDAQRVSVNRKLQALRASRKGLSEVDPNCDVSATREPLTPTPHKKLDAVATPALDSPTDTHLVRRIVDLENAQIVCEKSQEYAMQALSRQKQTAEDMIVCLKEQNALLEATFGSERDTLIAERDELVCKISSLSRENENIGRERREMRLKHQRCAELLKQQAQQDQFTAAKISSLESEVAAYRQGTSGQVNQLTEQLQLEKEERKKLQQEKEQWKQHLATYQKDAENDVASLLAELSSLREENEACREESEAMSADKADAMASMAMLIGKLQDGSESAASGDVQKYEYNAKESIKTKTMTAAVSVMKETLVRFQRERDQLLTELEKSQSAQKQNSDGHAATGSQSQEMQLERALESVSDLNGKNHQLHRELQELRESEQKSRSTIERLEGGLQEQKAKGEAEVQAFEAKLLEKEEEQEGVIAREVEERLRVELSAREAKMSEEVKTQVQSQVRAQAVAQALAQKAEFKAKMRAKAEALEAEYTEHRAKAERESLKVQSQLKLELESKTQGLVSRTQELEQQLTAGRAQLKTLEAEKLLAAQAVQAASDTAETAAEKKLQETFQQRLQAQRVEHEAAVTALKQKLQKEFEAKMELQASAQAAAASVLKVQKAKSEVQMREKEIAAKVVGINTLKQYESKHESEIMELKAKLRADMHAQVQEQVRVRVAAVETREAGYKQQQQQQQQQHKDMLEREVEKEVAKTREAEKSAQGHREEVRQLQQRVAELQSALMKATKRTEAAVKLAARSKIESMAELQQMKEVNANVNVKEEEKKQAKRRLASELEMTQAGGGSSGNDARVEGCTDGADADVDGDINECRSELQECHTRIASLEREVREHTEQAEQARLELREHRLATPLKEKLALLKETEAQRKAQEADSVLMGVRCVREERDAAMAKLEHLQQQLETLQAAKQEADGEMERRRQEALEFADVVKVELDSRSERLQRSESALQQLEQQVEELLEAREREVREQLLEQEERKQEELKKQRETAQAQQSELVREKNGLLWHISQLETAAEAAKLESEKKSEQTVGRLLGVVKGLREEVESLTQEQRAWQEQAVAEREKAETTGSQLQEARKEAETVVERARVVCERWKGKCEDGENAVMHLTQQCRVMRSRIFAAQPLVRVVCHAHEHAAGVAVGVSVGGNKKSSQPQSQPQLNSQPQLHKQLILRRTVNHNGTNTTTKAKPLAFAFDRVYSTHTAVESECQFHTVELEGGGFSGVFAEEVQGMLEAVVEGHSSCIVSNSHSNSIGGNGDLITSVLHQLLSLSCLNEHDRKSDSEADNAHLKDDNATGSAGKGGMGMGMGKGATKCDACQGKFDRTSQSRRPGAEQEQVSDVSLHVQVLEVSGDKVRDLVNHKLQKQLQKKKQGKEEEEEEEEEEDFTVVPGTGGNPCSSGFSSNSSDCVTAAATAGLFVPGMCLLQAVVTTPAHANALVRFVQGSRRSSSSTGTTKNNRNSNTNSNSSSEAPHIHVSCERHFNDGESGSGSCQSVQAVPWLPTTKFTGLGERRGVRGVTAWSDCSSGMGSGAGTASTTGGSGNGSARGSASSSSSSSSNSNSNSRSSVWHSHVVYSIRLSKTCRLSGEEMTSSGAAITVVDLANLHYRDEFHEATASPSLALRKEAQAMIQGASALKMVLEAVQRKDRYVPYRASRLTSLLQKCIGVGTKTLLLLHLPPDANEAESARLLHYGQLNHKTASCAGMVQSAGYPTSQAGLASGLHREASTSGK